ncbi:MAG: hypothetical protein R3F59_00310 [Myxococcota bacterium]
MPLVAWLVACAPAPERPDPGWSPPDPGTDYAVVEPDPDPPPEDTAPEPPPPPVEAESTDAGAWTGPARALYGTGSFFLGHLYVVDPADGSELFQIDTDGETVVGCAGEALGALVGSFSSSGVTLVDADGAPVLRDTWNNLTFPSAFTTLADGGYLVADEGLPALKRYDAAGQPAGGIPLSSIADSDGLAEPRWLMRDGDGAVWVGVARYNQFIGGGSPLGGAIALIPAGADAPSQTWPLGTDQNLSPLVVPHDGEVWLGTLGTVSGSAANYDGRLLAFDLETQELRAVLSDTAVWHVVARADGGGVWAMELLPDDTYRFTSVDWDGTVRRSLPWLSFATGLGVDADGMLWVADDSGLRIVDPADGSVVDVVHQGGVTSFRLCR